MIQWDAGLPSGLQGRYDDEAALMPPKVGGGWPTFPAVLEQIGRHAELL